MELGSNSITNEQEQKLQASKEQNMEERGFSEKIKPTSVHRSSSARSIHSARSNGTTLDDFEVISTIGTGSYGTCKKIKRKKDGKVLVWKELDYGAMSETEKQMLVSEVNLLRELKSPYIVKYYDRIIDRARTTIYIIMEYCKGGDLATIISRNKKDSVYLDEDFIWKILIQLTQALQECHQRKNGRAVLHRDMKPANVFLDMDKNVKLGDFGLARVLHHETSFANTYVGTPYYMSPELVNNMSYNEKSDIWSMGCVLYELCALHPPFVASSQTELNRKIRLGDFDRIPKRYSEDLNTIISKMLHIEVTKRPSIEELLADPIVVGRRAKMDRAVSTQLKGSGDCKVWANELRALEHDLEDKKRELERKERELSLREKMIEDKERGASVREKLAEEKYSRAEALLLEYERKMRLDTDKLLRGDSAASDLSGEGISSCLTKKKEGDTPKKKVSFDMYGKENQRLRDRYHDPLSKYSEYDSSYIQDLLKRHELKDRLYQHRGKDVRRSDDRGSRSRNLLLFR
ncbi:serine/threonine-protein kinase Nek2-like isoform X1 [Mya arenaria]|uniref:serine/threonine-protein kinase Nek2-like isoform X1 n=1 Tax=Mya arenaria TaxID=6604 RepID=UPI0022DF4270|nr:serine/threonine-protein kinase Nek2-like isoform X1 [Mya arenaria]